MTDEKRIEEIRARHAAATPAPWTTHRYIDSNAYCVEAGEEVASVYGTESTPAYDNAELVAHAPEDIAFLLAALDAERARAERAEAERDRAIVLAEREVADALVRSKERARRVYWTDYTTGEPYETGGDWPASEISVANEVCGFFRMLRMWTLEGRIRTALAEVARLREAMPSASLLEAIGDWMDRIEKARE